MNNHAATQLAILA